MAPRPSFVFRIGLILAVLMAGIAAPAVAQPGVPPDITAILESDQDIDPGQTRTYRVAVVDFEDESTWTFSGTGVTATMDASRAGAVRLSVTATDTAEAGARSLTVTNADGLSDSFDDAITVTGTVPPPVSGDLGGQVFDDTDGDGAFDAGETGLVGVAVTATDSNGVDHATITGSTGFFTLVGLAVGDAGVVYEPPVGYQPTTGNDTQTITIVNGTTLAAAVGYTRIPSLPSGEVLADPDTLSFGTVALGETAVIEVTLTNEADEPVEIATVASSAPEITAGLDTPATIGPGSGVLLPIEFSPVAAGAVSADLVVSFTDSAAPELGIAVTGRGGPFPMHSMGYIGCSNTDQHAVGYHDNTATAQFVPAYDTGGGTLRRWYTNERGHWSVYEANRPEGGFSAVWVQLCIRDGELEDDHETQLTTVIEMVRTLEGDVDVPIYVSPLNVYAEGHVCSSIGPDSPTVMAALAGWAVDTLGLRPGPVTGPVGVDDLRSDGCHLAKSGMDLVGTQLVDFFDPVE